MSKTSRTLDRRLERFAGTSLAIGGVLYFLFYGSTVGGFGLGDDYWMLSLSIHALSILAIVVGLIGGHAALSLHGWSSATWWMATGLAFLGLSVANVFFGVAAICLAIVTFAWIRAPWTGTLLAGGGGLWVYLYMVGVRVGDENARPRTETEELVGVIATVAIALGMFGLGLAATRTMSQRQEETAEQPNTYPERNSG
jgi:hypothetical protein